MKHLFLLVVLLLGVPAWAQNIVAVQVWDEAKKPIEGALVEAQAWTDDTALTPSALTGADGIAKLDVPLDEQGKLLPGRLTVAAKGFTFKGVGLGVEKREVQLERGATWRGKVVDAAGKPLAGAKVQVTGARADGEGARGVWISGEKIAALYTTLSGTDGSFQIEDLPAKMNLIYEVRLPGYAFTRGQKGLTTTEEIIKLAPGGALRGRVLDVEGKALPKVSLYANPASRGEGGNFGVSDENGFFTVESLAPGEYGLSVNPQAKEYVFPRLERLLVQAGKTTETPELRAVKGVEIRGLVRDAATKKPLAGGAVLADQDNETAAYKTSDKEGRFLLRVVPGTYRVYLSGVPQGYFRPNDQRNVDATVNAPTELTFDLQKAVTITGTTVDEAGNPIAARLSAGWRSEIKSDEAGKWEYTPTEKGALRLGGGDDETGYFEVVGPDKIDAPERGPNVIKVRKKPWGTLAGRVVGADGAPLEGVKVSATFHVPIGGGMSTSARREAVSDADGRFLLAKVRDSRDIKIEGEKAGFAFQEGGKIAKEGTSWIASNLVLVPLNRRIEGTTEPGARVTAAGRETIANQDGLFVLTEMPQGELSVFAAGDGFGSAIALGGEPVKIALQKQGAQGVDVALAEEIRAEARRDAVGKNFYRESDLQTANVATDFDAAIQNALGKAAGARDGPLLRAIMRWKVGDSLQTLQNGLDAISNADFRSHAALDAALKTGDVALSKKALQTAEQNFKSPEKETWLRERNLYLAAPVTDRLEGEKAGFAALDRAIVYTLKNHGEKSVIKDGQPMETGRDDMMASQAEMVAAGSLPLLSRLLDAIEPDSGYAIQALARAIPVVAKTHGVEVALPMLEELVEKPTPPPISGFTNAYFDPQYAFGYAARAVIPLLGINSPEKALQLAQRVRSNRHKARALAGAAQFQKGQAAAELWREVMSHANTEDAPRFAALAWRSDAKLGLEMFEIARDKVAGEMSQPYVQRNLWAPFAFYLAPADPAQARFLLEREWTLAKQKKEQEQSSVAIARAMSAVDGRRAWEMAKQIEDKENFWSLETRRKIAQYVATGEEERRDFPFDRWGVGDTWEPGDPEW